MYNGLFIYAQDGFVTGGKRFKGQPIRSFGTGARETDQKKLTGSGKTIFKKYDDNFKQGSAGAWLDIMKEEKGYDALVLFSDFQDGVTQYRIKGEKADANVQGGGYPIVYYDGIRTDIARGAGMAQGVQRCSRWPWSASLLVLDPGRATGTPHEMRHRFGRADQDGDLASHGWPAAARPRRSRRRG